LLRMTEELRLRSAVWNVCGTPENRIFRPSGAGRTFCFPLSYGLRHGLLSCAPVGGLISAASSPLGFLVCLMPPLFCLLSTGFRLLSSPVPEGRKKIAHAVIRGIRIEVECSEPGGAKDNVEHDAATRYFAKGHEFTRAVKARPHRRASAPAVRAPL
jgi:hypothetical protein